MWNPVRARELLGAGDNRQEQNADTDWSLAEIHLPGGNGDSFGLDLLVFGENCEEQGSELGESDEVLEL